MERRPRHGSRRAPSPPTRSACSSRVRESPRADLVSALIALAEIVRPHGLRGGAASLALEGIRSVAEAGALVGRLVAVPQEALAPLPRGTFYASALVGASVVTEDGVLVGEVAALEAAPGPGH